MYWLCERAEAEDLVPHEDPSPAQVAKASSAEARYERLGGDPRGAHGTLCSLAALRERFVKESLRGSWPQDVCLFVDRGKWVLFLERSIVKVVEVKPSWTPDRCGSYTSLLWSWARQIPTGRRHATYTSPRLWTVVCTFAINTNPVSLYLYLYLHLHLYLHTYTYVIPRLNSYLCLYLHVCIY